MDTYINVVVSKIAQQLQYKNLRLVTVESCTGGGVAYALTEVAGSSAWFEGGYVTYSNAAKMHMVGVPELTLAQHGAVSLATAQAMAQGALRQGQANVSLAITGIAGPGGGSSEKPVGTVCFAWASEMFATVTDKQLFTGDRQAIRQQSIQHALQRLADLLPC